MNILISKHPAHSPPDRTNRLRIHSALLASETPNGPWGRALSRQAEPRGLYAGCKEKELLALLS